MIDEDGVIDEDALDLAMKELDGDTPPFTTSEVVRMCSLLAKLSAVYGAVNPAALLWAIIVVKERQSPDLPEGEWDDEEAAVAYAAYREKLKKHGLWDVMSELRIERVPPKAFTDD